MRQKCQKETKIFCNFLGLTRIDLGPTYSHSKWEIKVTWFFKKNCLFENVDVFNFRIWNLLYLFYFYFF